MYEEVLKSRKENKTMSEKEKMHELNENEMENVSGGAEILDKADSKAGRLPMSPAKDGKAAKVKDKIDAKILGKKSRFI